MPKIRLGAIISVKENNGGGIGWGDYDQELRKPHPLQLPSNRLNLPNQTSRSNDTPQRLGPTSVRLPDMDTSADKMVLFRAHPSYLALRVVPACAWPTNTIELTGVPDYFMLYHPLVQKDPKSTCSWKLPYLSVNPALQPTGGKKYRSTKMR